MDINNFLATLSYGTKGRMILGKVPKEQLYKTFVRGILGGKNGLETKFATDNETLYSVYETIIERDKIKPEDFYSEYFYRCSLPVAVYEFGASQDVFLDIMKEFLTETVFNAESTESLAGRMFSTDYVQNSKGKIIAKGISLNRNFNPRIAKKGSVEDCILETAEFCLQEFGGNVVILPEESSILERVALERLSALKERLLHDYDQIDGTNIFLRKQFVDDRNNSQAVQQDIAENYKKIVDTYFLHPKNMFNGQNLSHLEFKKKAKSLNVALGLLEKRMNEGTIEKYHIGEQKAIADGFMQNLDMAFDTFGNGKVGSQILKVIDIVKAPKQINLTKKESDALENFQDNIQKLLSTLKKQKNPTERKLTFFSIMKMQPYSFVRVCNECSTFYGKFDAQSAKTAVGIVSGMFDEKELAEPTIFSTSNPLVEYNVRKMRTNGEVIIDLLDKDKFNNFVGAVDKYIKRNEMPDSEICQKVVAQAMIEKVIPDVKTK